MTTIFKKTVLIVLALSGLFSCQQFFTTSLGVPLARDSADKLPASLDSTNLPSVLESASTDPELALAVLEALPELIAAATTEEEQLLLLQGAIGAAEYASGMGTAMLTIATSLLDSILFPPAEEEGEGEEGEEGESGLEDMLVYIEQAMAVIVELPNLEATATALMEALPDPDTSAELYNSLVTNTDIETLTFSALVLVMSDIVYPDPENTEGTQMALSLMTAVTEQYDPETDSEILGIIGTFVRFLSGGLEMELEP